MLTSLQRVPYAVNSIGHLKKMLCVMSRSLILNL